MGIKTIIIAAVILLGAGGGAYYAANKDSGNGSDSQAPTGQGLGGSKSINELLSSGNNIRCTYQYTDDKDNITTGNIFVAGDKLRGSFSIQNAKGTQNSNVLKDGQHQYVWQDGSNSGFKTEISALNGQNVKDDTQAQQTVDQDKKYDFDCSEWSVDQSIFKPPANVNFTDYTKQLQQSQNQQENAREMQQEACENLSGQAREACERAY